LKNISGIHPVPDVLAPTIVAPIDAESTATIEATMVKSTMKATISNTYQYTASLLPI
jgi:hypothetical protein